MEEIVVTARKREENLQDAPLAVSALSAASIERRNIRRVDDLSKAVPNLNIETIPGKTGTISASLRGITATDFILSNDPAIAMYVDGVYLSSNTGALLSVADLERVEVLRGPQGTLSGRNATGGAISLITKGPKGSFGVEQKLGYATYHDITSRTTVDTDPLGPFTARLSYYLRRAHGYVDNTVVPAWRDPGSNHTDAGFLAIHGDFGPNFTLDYKFTIDREKNGPINSQVVVATPTELAFLAQSPALGGATAVVQREPITSFSGVDYGPAIIHVESQSLTLNWGLNENLKLKSISGYRRVKLIGPQVQGSFGPIAARFPPAGAVQLVPLGVIANDTEKYHTMSEELQLSGTYDNLTFVTGVFLYRQKYDEIYPQGSRFLLPIGGGLGFVATSTFAHSGESRSSAVFGQASYTPDMFDRKLELTAGARYTADRKHLEQTLATVRSFSKRFHNLSAEGSAKYKWAEGVMTYLRIAQAYKAGGANPRNGGLLFTPYRPEKALSYEAGIKADLADRRIRINADVYHTDYKDLQLGQLFAAGTRPGCATICTLTVNAGKATYDGVEVETTILPARGWEISGAVGYVDPKYQEFLAATSATDLTPVDIAGLPTTKFSYTAKYTVSGSVQYTFDHMSFGDLSARVNYYYHSSRYWHQDGRTSTFNEQIKDHGYADVGAQINLTNIPTGVGEFDLQVYGRNLRGKRPVVWGVDLNSLGYASQGFGPGRTFGVELTGRF